MHLQQSRGNRYVQRLLDTARPPTGQAPIVGAADDRYEHEADQVAQQVTTGHTGQPAADGAPPQVTRVSTVPVTSVAQDGAARSGVQRALRSAPGGRPLPERLRGPLEGAFGADFGDVRLHIDGRADRLNRALRARAFTTGRDIFFRRGEYDPGSPAGQRVLAHELTHVVQQGGATARASSAPIQRKFTYGRTPIDPDQSIYILNHLLREGLLSGETDQDLIEKFRSAARSAKSIALPKWLKDRNIEVKSVPELLTRSFASAGTVWVPSKDPVQLLELLLEHVEDHEMWDEGLIGEIRRSAIAVDVEAFLAWLKRRVFPDRSDKGLLRAVLRGNVTVAGLLTAVFPDEKNIARRYRKLLGWETGEDESSDEEMPDEPVDEPFIRLDEQGNYVDAAGRELADADAMRIDIEFSGPPPANRRRGGRQAETGEREAMLEEIFTVASWNLEKYGAKTEEELKAAKRAEIVRILRDFQPTLLTLQEVTDAVLLHAGRLRGEVPVGFGLALADLLGLDEKYPVGQDEEGRRPAYPLQQEYGMVPGPRYEAGKTYKEYYPLFYKTAEVAREPKPFFVVGQPDEGYQLVAAGAQQTFSSGKSSTEDAAFREPLFWYVEKIEPYTASGNRRSRRLTPKEIRKRFPGLRAKDVESARVTPIFLGVVHTSPSNVMGIKQEITELMQKAKWLEGRTRIPVHLAGDFYMEQQSKELWERLTGGTEAGWELGASEKVEGDTLYSTPFAKKAGKNTAQRRKQYDLRVAARRRSRHRTTNFPHHGQGGTADIQVNSTTYIDKVFATLLSPTMQHDIYLHRPIDENKDLGEPLREMGADHATTFVGLAISAEVLTEAERAARIREATKKKPKSQLGIEGRREQAVQSERAKRQTKTQAKRKNR